MTAKEHSEDLAKRREKAKASHIGGVVESFYCNQDDGEYNNNPCLEQCIFCKEVDNINVTNKQL